jgi:hypothetical protein
MYIFYKIYPQWIYWTLFFIAHCSTIFASELPKDHALNQMLFQYILFMQVHKIE